MNNLSTISIMLLMVLPIDIATATNSKKVEKQQLSGWVQQVFHVRPAYILIDSVKYRVPNSARISERYEATSLRLKHLVPGLKVKFHIGPADTTGVADIRSIEIIPQ